MGHSLMQRCLYAESIPEPLCRSPSTTSCSGQKQVMEVHKVKASCRLMKNYYVSHLRIIVRCERHTTILTSPSALCGLLSGVGEVESLGFPHSLLPKNSTNNTTSNAPTTISSKLRCFVVAFGLASAPAREPPPSSDPVPGCFGSFPDFTPSTPPPPPTKEPLPLPVLVLLGFKSTP